MNLFIIKLTTSNGYNRIITNLGMVHHLGNLGCGLISMLAEPFHIDEKVSHFESCSRWTK